MDATHPIFANEVGGIVGVPHTPLSVGDRHIANFVGVKGGVASPTYMHKLSSHKKVWGISTIPYINQKSLQFNLQALLFMPFLFSCESQQP